MIETRRLIELKLVCRGVGSLVAIVPIPFLARISNNRRITPTIVRSAREAGIEIFQMPRVPTETLYASRCARRIFRGILGPVSRPPPSVQADKRREETYACVNRERREYVS